MSWGDESYQERFDRQIPAEDKPVGGKRRKKDTKRWCKGKVGREHVTEIRPAKEGYRRECGPPPEFWKRAHWFYGGDAEWWCKHQEVCTVCGKILRWKIGADECPDRADA